MKTISTKLFNMKKISQFNVKNDKSIIGVSTVLASALLITGCQSTNLGQPSTIAANNTSVSAKTVLATALQQQRRQSFAYHSNLEINNDQQFVDVDSKQVAGSNHEYPYCEETHDADYIALLDQAEAQEKDILSADYNRQREALKQSYQKCTQAYQAWEDNLSDREVSDADTDLPSHESAFAEFGNTLNKIDIKKAQLLDAYLLKPLSINAQGVYQPLAGKFTMLTSAQYQTRNHHSSINQPIYIDFKTGNIYLWADNFALLTSKLLDDKLGNKWQNKWLKLTIDDGTLPEGFGRAVIKNHFEALDRTYEIAPVTQFDFIAPNTLAALTPKLPEQQLAPMLQRK
jgi:hypothetical protein